ncbi:MAG TPA: sigma-54-dependent Fis family transcriptional regulator [Candidatus Latescibacteria bacterium]|nr:sigma-54-dependent Fis family transcriptional regulator [Candidatus Latescibacterota bacterium]
MNQAQYPSLPVLLVDDEEQFLLSASVTLSSAGINNTVGCQDSREVMRLLAEQNFELVVLDILMPYVPGNELLPKIVRDYPDIPVIMITAVNELETAVECMKSGAFDYLVKPVDDERLVTCIRRAIEFREMRDENTLLKQYLLSDKLEHPEAFSAIVTQNSTMRSIFQYVEAIAGTSLPVLITGETGVGKELIAKAIHRLSRRTGEFVPVNVAGVDDTLFSDTLFGHKKGAFTGAHRDRKGLIEKASGGTLFLDEIGDLSIESQVKLLRLLQEGKYYPIGSDVPKLTDVRIVVATNKDIEAMQQTGRFRKDLYYRLQAHHVHLPPLRERLDDIPLLVEHFLQKAAKILGKKKPTPPRELFTLLGTYHFPGNIRELEGMIFDAVSRHKFGVLSMEPFRAKITARAPAQKTIQINEQELLKEESKKIIFTDQLPTLKDAEQMLITEALKRSNGNQTIAAQMLGLSRKALNNRLRRANR